MKKIILAIITLSILFVACQKDEEQDTVNLTAIAADNNSVNAKYYINGHYGCWQDTDRVVINGDNYNLKVVNTSTATIENVVENTSVGYTAGYPASQVSNMINGVSVEFNLPETQYYKTTKIASGEATTAQDIINPMIAYCEPGGSVLKFYNVASVLKLNITNTTGAPIQVHYVMVESETSNLCGTGTVNVSSLAGANPAPVLTVDGSTKSVTLDCCAEHPSIANGSTLPVYIVLPAFGSSESKEHLTFTVLAQDASKKKYTFTKSTNTISGHEGLFLERSQIVNATLNLTEDMGGDAEAFWGKGSSGCPYLITDQDDLEALRSFTNEGTDGYCGDEVFYKQTADITLDEWGNTAIGNTSSKAFSAHYDGGGHSISNISISTSTANESLGLFGYAGGGSVKGLSTEGSITCNAYSSYAGIGGIVGEITDAIIISSCSSNVSIYDNAYYGFNGTSVTTRLSYGGIVGLICGGATQINNCIFSGTISQIGTSRDRNPNYGGIVGANMHSETELSHCTNNGTITLTRSENSNVNMGKLGGICGSTWDNITINNCYNSGAMSSANSGSNSMTSIGGIIGAVFEGYDKDYYSKSITLSVEISNCENTGDVTLSYCSSGYAGGIIGSVGGVNCINLVATITIESSRNSANIYSDYRSGGILGGMYTKKTSSLSITSCSNNLNEGKNNQIQAGGGYCGGIVGSIYRISTCSITSSQNHVPIVGTSGADYYGGIIGNCVNAEESSYYLTITNCINDATISISGKYVGGILGYANKLPIQIKNCSNTGVITATSDVGGIVGKVESRMEISDNTYNDASVTGSGGSNVGGIVGYAATITINDVENKNTSTTEEIKGYYNVGGILGYTSSGGSTLQNCSNDTKIIATSSSAGSGVGGILGRSNTGSTTIINCKNTAPIEISYSGGKQNFAAGIVGSIGGSNVNIKNCYNSGDISGDGYAIGGIIGRVLSDVTVANCYNSGNLAGSLNTRRGSCGGIVGQCRSTSSYPTRVNNCYSTGSITGVTGQKINNIASKYDSSIYYLYVYNSYSSISGNFSNANTNYGCARFNENGDLFNLNETTTPVSVYMHKLNTSSTTGTSTYSTLKDALDAWVTTNSSGNYSTWSTDDMPIFNW